MGNDVFGQLLQAGLRARGPLQGRPFQLLLFEVALSLQLGQLKALRDQLVEVLVALEDVDPIRAGDVLDGLTGAVSSSWGYCALRKARSVGRWTTWVSGKSSPRRSFPR